MDVRSARRTLRRTVRDGFGLRFDPPERQPERAIELVANDCNYALRLGSCWLVLPRERLMVVEPQDELRSEGKG